MSELFDNISRIVGSPIPRRQALKAIGGALVGVVFAGSAYRKARAADFYYCCPGDGGACSFLNTAALCNPNNPWDEATCTAAGFQWVAGGVCCPDGHVCQGGVCCGALCCSPDSVCIAGECCPQERVCCNNTVCCDPGTIASDDKQLCCPQDQYIPTTQTCCPTGTVYVASTCCQENRKCKDPATGNDICCPSGKCCGGTKCCPGGCTPDGMNCAFNVTSPRRI